uniref:Ycf34 n=1 Tax=Cliftonaea pectinata TaxID=2007206 RepID=A0A1Z1MQX4_9FLOR|nr:hypothetical protein [Cliftonaea pectinata]ARW68144.1 hypothetical protein [Cliftonaea pectinata]
MCICINCRHIYNCEIYRFIEEQHKEKLTKRVKPSFIPNDTILNINIDKRYNNITFDWDLIECLSFIEEPGLWGKNIKKY